MVVDLADVATGSGVLVVRSGPSAGQRIALDLPLTRLGRHPESDIMLDDITVSRRHAEIERLDDGGYEVRDVGSLNGTYVNQERVERTRAEQRRRAPDRQVPLVFLDALGGTA